MGSILLFYLFQFISVDGQNTVPGLSATTEMTTAGNSSATRNDVRLVGGQSKYEGMVEVYYNGSWGVICDDAWDINDAEVVCRMLGYSAIGASAVCCSEFGSSVNMSIVLDEVKCTGGEGSIYNCTHNQWFSHDCCHKEYAGVRCGKSGSVGVRLVDGQHEYEGRVEIYFNGSWGTICDDSWDDNDAAVVCRMLGYRTAVSYPTFRLNNSLNIFLDEVNCNGDESSLYNCNHAPWQTHDCTHLEDAGVRCLDMIITTERTTAAMTITTESTTADNLPAEFLLIVNDLMKNIYRVDINTSAFVQIQLQNDIISVLDIDYDPTAAVILWTNGSHINSASILRKGQNAVLSLTDDAAMIYGIAADSISRLLFYTDVGNDIIAVISLEHYLQKKVIHRDLYRSIHIVTDPAHGIIYWINDNHKIMKSNYEGTKKEVLHSFSLPLDGFVQSVSDLDLDINAGVLYWCALSVQGSTIGQVNVNGSRPMVVYSERGSYYKIALYHSYLYLSDYSGIYRIRTDGTDFINIPTPLYVYPGNIHVHVNTSRGINGCSNGRGNCSHLCFPLADGSKMCACPDLMKLQPDNLTCENGVPDNFLLLTANASAAIYLMDLSNNNYYKISIQDLHNPYAITYDHINEEIFWTDNELHQILSVSLYAHRGSGKVLLQLRDDTSLRGISVDAMSDLLFYADHTSGIIAALSLDGSKHKVVINSSLDKPNAIVTDPINGVIYWTSYGGEDGMIKNANYDGTNQQRLIGTDIYPNGLAIDFQAGVLYWCMYSVIKKANVSDLNRKLAVSHEEKTEFSRIAIYESYLYYIALNKRSVMRIGTDGSRNAAVGPDVQFVDIYLNTIRSESTGTNGCSNKSHGCSHFCFPRPGGSKVCACPDDMNLQPDNHTCGPCAPPKWNTTNDSPYPSCEIYGSSEELTVLRAAVGSLAGLLLIGLLTIFWLIRNNRRMGVKKTDKLPNTNSMATVDENDDYHTIPTAINNDLRNEPEALCSISSSAVLYRPRSDNQEGYMSPNNSGENLPIDYIHCV